MERCDTCGRDLSFGATISVTGRGTYCSSCYNEWLAKESGVRFDNTDLDPVTLRDAAGVSHTFRIHSRFALGAGHVMEAIEEETDGYGYQFKVMGPEESDAMTLFSELYARMRSGLARQYVRPAQFGPQLVHGHELEGRIELDPESDDPVVVVDGRPLSWAATGHLLRTYEGWTIRIEMTDPHNLAPGNGEPQGSKDDAH